MNQSDNEVITNSANIQSGERATAPAVNSESENQAKIAAMIDEARSRLDELPETDCRDLSKDFLRRHEIGYLPNWRHPKSPPNSIPTPRFIFRLGGVNAPPSFNAVLTPSGRERFKNSDAWEAQKCLTAGSKLIFNPAALSGELTCVTEGEIDSLSVEFATDGKIKACALGGARQFGDLINRLKMMKHPPRILILFDKDEGTSETGQHAAIELINKLSAIGVAAVAKFFEDFMDEDLTKLFGGKVDANAILQNCGKEALSDILNRIIDDVRADFEQVEADIRREQEAFRKIEQRRDKDKRRENFSDEIQALIDKINSEITDTELVNKGYLQHSERGAKAPDGYCCPFCGSGTNTHKTGALKYITDDGAPHFGCGKCGRGGNVITLIAHVENLSTTGKEFFETLKFVADKFSINYDPKIFEPSHRFKRDPLTAAMFASNDVSDLEFAKRLASFCGNEIRWLTDERHWLLYQRNTHGGGVWVDSGEQNACLLPKAREMTELMIEHAKTKDERKVAKAFTSSKKISGTITMLKGDKSLLITADDLDTHDELICCLNGAVDLNSGKLLTVDPKTLLMTQTVNATFGEPSKAAVEFVQNFFAAIQPDETTRAGLLRWLGYCLTGDTSAEKFMVWIGESGANGKGTLGATILNLFGGYGVGLTPRALCKTSRPADADKATTALNGLIRRRFAISEEMPMDGELDLSLVKNLTGGDPINLRRNYSEFRTLINRAKLNISGNYAARIENVHDGGILRRILYTPFNQKFGTPENPADPTLKRRLLEPENLSALFAILVREAAAFYRDGLIISEMMKKATEQHLNESDFVADFLSEYYEFGEGLFIKASDLINDLKDKRPRECAPFRKRADLIKAIEAVKGVSYTYDRNKIRIFEGVGRPQKSKPTQGSLDLDGGGIISSANYPPFD